MDTLAIAILHELRRVGALTAEELARRVQQPVELVRRALLDNDFVFSPQGSAGAWAVLAPNEFVGALQFRRPMRPWQVEAMQEWMANDRHGVVEAVTGAGKTDVGVAAIADARRRGVSSVVLVPDRGLVDQWVQALEVAFPRVPIASLNATDTSAVAERMIVTTVADLNGRNLTGFDRGGLLVADEIQRFTVTDYTQGMLPLRSFGERLGLTAAYEWPVEASERLLKPFFGRTIAGCDYRRAVTESILARPRVLTIGVSFKRAEKDEYDRLSKRVDRAARKLVNDGVDTTGGVHAAARAIAADVEIGSTKFLAREYLEAYDARGRVMAECHAKAKAVGDLAHSLGQAHRATVFTQNDLASSSAVKAIQEVNVPAAAVYENADAAKLIGMYSSGVFQVLATSRLLDEGVAVPTSQVGVIMGASRSWAQMAQRMGRVIRPARWNRPAVIVVIYVNGTMEDPVVHAEDTYFEVLRDAAEVVEDVDAATAAIRLADWLSEDEVGAASDDAGSSQVDEAVVGRSSQWSITEAILDVFDEYAGFPTWEELREVLPDLEVEDLLMKGLDGVNWMRVGDQLVGAGGREVHDGEARISALGTLASTFRRMGGLTLSMTDLAQALRSSDLLANRLPDNRMAELWTRLGGALEEVIPKENAEETKKVAEPVGKSAAEEQPVAPPRQIGRRRKPEQPNPRIVGRTPSRPRTTVGPRKVVNPDNTNKRALRTFVEAVVARGGRSSPYAGSHRSAVTVIDCNGGKHVVRVRGGVAGVWKGNKRDEIYQNEPAGVCAFVDLSTEHAVIYLITAKSYSDRVRAHVDRLVAEKPGQPRVGPLQVGIKAVADGRDAWDLVGLPSASSVPESQPSTPSTPNLMPAKAIREHEAPSEPAPVTVFVEPVKLDETPGDVAKVVLSSKGEIRAVMEYRGQEFVGFYDPKGPLFRIAVAPGAVKLVDKTFRNAATAAATVKSSVAGEVVFSVGATEWIVDQKIGTTLEDHLTKA